MGVLLSRFEHLKHQGPEQTIDVIYPCAVSCSTFSKCSFQQNMSITLVNQIPQKLEARKLGRVGMTPNKWATLDLANVNDDLSVAPKRNHFDDRDSASKEGRAPGS
jgi:hypothetical protein